jgi:hypothetical protein
MKRSFLLLLALIVLFAQSVVAESAAPTRKLEAIPHELEAHPEGLDPQWTIELDSIVQSATIAEIRQVLPALVSLSESPIAPLRTNALLALYAIAGRNKAGLPENHREQDLMAGETMIPYLSRLEPRLMDSATPSRALSLMLFEELAALRPTPPELIKAALTVLKSSQSTQPMPDTTQKSPTGMTSSPGPQMLWVLLPAAADFYVDPATNITEGRDSAEVQEAIIQFLHRSDQTRESLSESIRALAVAQPQNPAVNAELLPLLNSQDVSVQEALLQNIARLTLTSKDFASARTRVASIETNPKTPMDLRQIASALLQCWSNDRHHDVCPAL